MISWTIPVCHAQQPFYTDDADVTGKGKLQIEYSNQFDILQRSSHPVLSQNTSSFEVNYGLLDNTEIALEVQSINIFHSHEVHPTVVTGVGDTNFSLKHNFLKEKENSRLPALSLGLGINMPTGNANQQLGSGITSYAFNGIAQKSIPKQIKLRANGGITLSGNVMDETVEDERSRELIFTGGISIVKEFSTRLQLGIEANGAATRNPYLTADQLFLQIGGNYALKENLTLDVGIIGGLSDASPRLGVQLGFSLDF
jgi:hypothetical protein